MNFPTYKRMNSRDYSETMDVEDNSGFLQNDNWQASGNPSWKRSLPHVLVATLTSFLFGYHLGVVNEPLESISRDLGFKGNTMAEGLVVSICLGGAFVGCAFSGSISDGLGRRRAFQLSAIPMVLGGVVSAMSKTLQGMLLGRLLVGTGIGLGPSVASLYVAEISPAFVRGTYGSLIQIATCLGLMSALVVGIPSKDVMGWWRMCFWLSTIPAATLGLGMILCAESPIWLHKQGRILEAEAEFEKLLGGPHVHSAMAELEKSDRGDTEDVKLLELLSGRHSRVVFIGSALYALQQLSGINAVFYFSSTVFKSVGVPSNLTNVLIGISNIAGSIIALTLMDKLGRKLLLFWSFLGMALSMGLQVAGASSYMPKAVAFYLSVGGILLAEVCEAAQNECFGTGMDDNCNVTMDGVDEGNELSDEQFGYPRAESEKWASCIRVLDPRTGQTMSCLELENNEAALSICVVNFRYKSYGTLLAVGTTKSLQFLPKRRLDAAYIHIYRLVDGGGLELLHKTQVDGVPLALCQFQGRLLAGTGTVLRLYDLGKKRLLRKCENKLFPTTIVSLHTLRDRIYVGDIQESFHYCKYRRDENQLYIFADDIYPRWLTASVLVFNFLVGLLFLRLLEKLGPQLLYTIFSTVCLVAVAFVKRNVIETKGRTLQEIEIALLPDE